MDTTEYLLRVICPFVRRAPPSARLRRRRQRLRSWASCRPCARSAGSATTSRDELAHADLLEVAGSGTFNAASKLPSLAVDIAQYAGTYGVAEPATAHPIAVVQRSGSNGEGNASPFPRRTGDRRQLRSRVTTSNFVLSPPAVGPKVADAWQPAFF